MGTFRVGARGALLLSGIITALAASPAALADGTEVLGPSTLPVASGTGITGAGVGLEDVQPGTITVNVPAGATVEQVILYWEGNNANGTVDNPEAISVNGVGVDGTFIGGLLAGGGTQFQTFRADITGLGAVTEGASNLQIQGLDFTQNNGAGALVVYSEPSAAGPATLGLADGNDRAYFAAAPPEDVTQPVTFNFAASASDRSATIVLFFSDVVGTVSGTDRPTSIEIKVDGMLVETLTDALTSADGNEWDTVIHTVNIPAGATSLTLQAFSRKDAGSVLSGNPASFSWITAGLSIAAPPGGGEGCTPGYWKQPHHFDSWTAPYAPTTLFSDVFENAFPGKTLLQVLRTGGGGKFALGRHTVAALLNAASGGVDYAYTPQDVIDAFNAVFPGTKAAYIALKNDFQAENESGCPLN